MIILFLIVFLAGLMGLPLLMLFSGAGAELRRPIISLAPEPNPSGASCTRCGGTAFGGGFRRGQVTCTACGARYAR